MSRHWPWALSLGAHGALVLVLVGVGAQTRHDLPARAPSDAIEIEIDLTPGPPAQPGPAAPATAAAQVPVPPLAVAPPVEDIAPPVQAVPPRRAPAPAQSVPPVRAPAPAPGAGAPDTPAPPSAPAPSNAPADAPDAPAAAAGALSMRSSARAPGPGDLLARPGRPASGPAPGSVIDLSPAHAARMALPDPGPPPSSPLDLPGPPPAAPDVRAGWMPIGGGDYAVASPGFTARIARDGQVTIDDKPSFQVMPGMPRLTSETLTDPSTGEEEPQVMLKMDVAVFDLTDWVMRMSGMDPYSSAKLRLLDQTREVRAEMRARARVEDLRDAIAMLPRLLDTIWHEPGLPAAERRALLFRIWDECAEIGRVRPGGAGPDSAADPDDGPPDGADDGPAGAEPRDHGEPGEDDALARASRTARATVLGYIRRNLPAGSPDAYTAAEIDALNAQRRSAERFAPYP